MKRVHNKGLNKFISFYLSVLLLVAGMCFNYAETDSFFAYIHNYMNATTLEKTSSTIENANVRTLVTLFTSIGNKIYRKAKYGISLYD